MPIKIPENLPSRTALEAERIPLILEKRALRQDIRPLQVAILNLMPAKTVTETQLLRALGLSPLQIEVTLLHMASHNSKNTAREYLATFYKTHADVRDGNFDALIVTGAPVGQLSFEEVTYWKELTEIFDWAKTHVHSTLFICWGALAALHYYEGIEKRHLPQKLSGIYRHHVLHPFSPLTAGFDDFFDVPVSRHNGIRTEDILRKDDLDILVASDEAGAFIIHNPKEGRVYLLNHLEYDAETLKKEYERDLLAGLNPGLPANYFPDNNPLATPQTTWRAHRTLLFSNWINAVYQGTPYNLSELSSKIEIPHSEKRAAC